MADFYPDFDTYRQLAERGNLVPVVLEMMGDLETPVSVFLKLAADSPHAFLLESVEQGGRLGRYSFVGYSPKVRIASRDRRVTITDWGSENEAVKETVRDLEDGEDPLTVLEATLKPFKAVQHEKTPPFYGGLVGFLGYEMVGHFERLQFTGRDDYGIPDSVFYLTDKVVVFDHVERRVSLVATLRIDGDVDATYEASKKLLGDTRRRLARTLENPGFGAGLTEEPEMVPNRTKDDFKEAVGEAIEHIRAGDVFQIVVSLRNKITVKSTPIDLYRALRQVNPSPYTFFLRDGDTCLIGASPEILVRLEDRRVTYRPLAGTRPRGRTDEEDSFLERELISDPKERAEHIMLVDLGRNDIGRVCEYHTVKVDELLVVERYSHVMHLVSNVIGVLAEEKNPFDLLRATFPAGTLTGSPKIRAMEIIDRLEPTRRGPYGGCVGYISYGGNMDTCITLRTIVMVGNQAYVQAGAGIVADSDPDLEYQECCNKSRALWRSIAMCERTSDRPESLTE